jgi:4,5:9,10-diseco-3-hydroxy-5,9,17-trioxoandrosta-1(10),2-diene-4-oate hydrolase
VKNKSEEKKVKNKLETEPAPQSSPAIEERWAVVDGYRMRYLCGGAGPALVLVHGLLGYSFSWRHALPVLSEKATVYAVDMLGVGFSDRPPNLDCRFQAHAERLLAFLDGVGITSCDLLGTSHGGAVAMMAAALAPERVQRLILVAPANPWSTHGKVWARFLTSRPMSWLILRLGPGMEVAHDLMLRRLYGDRSRIRPGTLAGYSAPLGIPGAFKYWLDVMITWNRDLDELQSAMPRIAHIPALLLWGGKDRAVDPASAAELRRQFTDCQIEIYDGVGHLPYEEVPERFNSSIMQFLSANSRLVS